MLGKEMSVCSWSQLVLACLPCFSQDSQDPNPLIRALAVRTMGCIRVDRITEYLCDPLQRCIKVGIGPSAWHSPTKHRAAGGQE